MALTAITAAVKGMRRELVLEAAARFDELATASAARVVGNGGTMRMHTRKGRRPVKMATKVAKVYDRDVTVTAVVVGNPKAMWVWIEDGTRAHDIGRGRVLSAPGYPHPVKGPIHHPGSRGQKAWSRAVNEFKVEYPKLALNKVKKKVSGG